MDKEHEISQPANLPSVGLFQKKNQNPNIAIKYKQRYIAEISEMFFQFPDERSVS